MNKYSFLIHKILSFWGALQSWLFWIFNTKWMHNFGLHLVISLSTVRFSVERYQSGDRQTGIWYMYQPLSSTRYCYTHWIATGVDSGYCLYLSKKKLGGGGYHWNFWRGVISNFVNGSNERRLDLKCSENKKKCFISLTKVNIIKFDYDYNILH